jgi:hypothetical protein
MANFDYNKASQWHMIISRDGITPITFPKFNDKVEESIEDSKIIHESLHYFNRVIPE